MPDLLWGFSGGLHAGKRQGTREERWLEMELPWEFDVVSNMGQVGSLCLVAAGESLFLCIWVIMPTILVAREGRNTVE